MTAFSLSRETYFHLLSVNGLYCTEKDEKIMQVIFETIGNHPDKSTNQILNVRNLKKILDNPALLLDLLRILGFEYTTTNKIHLKFIGVSLFIANEHLIHKMVQEEKISLILFQHVLRACFRTNENTRRIFDSNTQPMGAYISSYYISDHRDYIPWENRTMSDKIQKTLCVQELCNVKHFSDWHRISFTMTHAKTGRQKQYDLTVFNNNGKCFKDIDWDAKGINELVSNASNAFNNVFDNHVSNIIKLAETYQHPVDFVKRSIYFLKECLMDSLCKEDASYGSSHAYSLQKARYQLLSMLRKHESVFTASQYYLANICRQSKRQDYIESTIEPKVYRLNESKKTCQKIQKTILSKDSKHSYVWRCLLCNTFNQYRTCEGCPSCTSYWTDIEKLISLSPLYLMNCNKSKSFCIDPRDKPFYIIGDYKFCETRCEMNDENTIIKKYSKIQAMIEKKSNLKLTTIIVHVKAAKSIFLTLFEKSDPLTLYELKHILYEVHMQKQYWDSATHWTLIDVIFDMNDKNELSKLSDDNKIDFSQPCYIDLEELKFIQKPRRPVEFGKIEYKQGLYHSYCNINIEKIKNASSNNSQGNLDTNNKFKRKNIVSPFKATKVTQVFTKFDYIHSPPLVEQAHHEAREVRAPLNEKSWLVVLTKEVIKNGFEKDLLPVSKMNNNKNSVDMIDKIVNEFEMKPHTHELGKKTIEIGQGVGEYNKFLMELVRELSKLYKIFDKFLFESKMFHSRHKMMGYPLMCCEMLALMLYCDGECNYDLCKSQRSHTVIQKWPYFHFLLNRAIERLSQFEIHYEHIYTGVCGVHLEISNDVQFVHFQTNVSFSTDFDVALQFRGDSGVIIGLNMKRIVNKPSVGTSFQACDVSWISSHEEEKEILCFIGSTIMIYPNFLRNRDNNQWIVWVEDELNENIAFGSMFGSLAD